MAWKLTIGGTDRTALVRGVDHAYLEFPFNGRATARFTIKPGLIPARFSEVVIYAQDGTTPLFGGVITGRTVTGLAPQSAASLTAIDCADFGVYLDWCSTSLSYTGDVSVEDVVADLVSTTLGTYGLTYTPTVTGVTLAPFAWASKRCSDALREVCDKAGLVYSVTPAKAILVYAPGATAAPVTITDADTHCETLEWVDIDTVPSTKVVLSCGTSGTFMYTGTRTANGTDTSWVFDVRGLTPPYSVAVGAGYATVTPVGGGGEFEWSLATYTLTVGTAATPTAGTVIVVSYWVGRPFVVIAPKPPLTPGTPVIEYLASAPDIIDVASGQDYADALLARVNQSPRELVITTRELGFAPGQKLTVDIAGRSVDADFSITSVSMDLITSTFWRSTVRATESVIYQGGYLDQWRTLTGGMSSGLSIAGGSVVSPTGSPFHAHIGGSRSRVMTGTSWEPIAECKTVTAHATGTYTFRFEAVTENAATSIAVRLWDETASAVVVTSSAITATTWAAGRTALSVLLTIGHVYYAEYENSDAVYGTLVGQASVEM